MLRRPGPAGARRTFWVLAAASVLTLTWLGRGLTFWADEWAFIAERRLADPGTWWSPHNEHWSTLFVIVYRALVETVGLSSYLPYLLVIALLHALVGWLVFRAVERGAGPDVALGAAFIVLFFGSGFENLFWGFQVAWVGTMVLGLGTLDLLEGPPSGRRAALVVGALVAAEMTAGIGALFVGAAGVMMLTTPAWRRWTWVLAAPAAAYATWFLLAGWAGLGTFRDPLTPSSIAAIPGFLVSGFGAALGSATGLQPLGPLLVLVAAVAAGAALARGARPSPRVLALLAAVLAHYTLIAVTRAGVTELQVLYPRYTYVSGIFMVQVLALVGGPVLSRVATRHRADPRFAVRLGALAAGPVVLAVAMAWNLQLLVVGRSHFLERAAIIRALVQESIRPDPPPGADLTRDLILIRSPLVTRQLVEAHGSPLTDVILPWAVEPIPERDLLEARRRLVEGPPVYVPEDAP